MWKSTLTLNMVVWQSQLNIHSLAFLFTEIASRYRLIWKCAKSTVLSLQKISITTEQTWSGDTGYGIKVNTVFKFNQFPWRWDCILDFKSKKKWMHCIIIHLQRLHMLPVGEQDNIFTYFFASFRCCLIWMVWNLACAEKQVMTRPLMSEKILAQSICVWWWVDHRAASSPQ